jgi:hypothetical protein
MRVRNFLVLGLMLLGMTTTVFAQHYHNGSYENDYNVITTAVPFVSIAPDARGGSMGDCGVASSADAYSMHYNPAKYVFMKDRYQIGLGYSPWLHNLVSDMNLAYLAFGCKITDRDAIGATLRYFNCGNITFVDENNQNPQDYKPNEFAIDVAYSRLLTEYLSASVAGRFIYSNLTQGYSEGSTAGWSVAADVALYYQRPLEFRTFDADIAWGINISNIGSKVSYSNSSVKKDFIPTMLRFGPSMNFHIDDYNSIAVNVDITKLLVPTPPIYARDSLGRFIVDENGDYVIEKGRNPNVSTVMGMIQSIYDAPGGFKEEMCEFNIGVGVEYCYNNIFSVRTGYFNEPRTKGNRKYVTFGAGVHYKVFALDVSYLLPVSGKVGTNPLENTLRFNLTFNFGGETKTQLE